MFWNPKVSSFAPSYSIIELIDRIQINITKW